MRTLFAYQFRLTASVENILTLLGGPEELENIKVANCENFNDGLIVRIYGVDWLDLRAVVAIEPDGVGIIVSVQFANVGVTFEEFRIDGHELRDVFRTVYLRALSD